MSTELPVGARVRVTAPPRFAGIEGTVDVRQDVERTRWVLLDRLPNGDTAVGWNRRWFWPAELELLPSDS